MPAHNETGVAPRTQQAGAPEQHFSWSFEYMPVGVAEVSSDGRLLRVNGAFCELLKYPAGELLSRVWNDLVYPDDVAADAVQWRRLLSGETNSYRVVRRYVRRDHELLWARLTRWRVESLPGEPPRALSVLEDVSEQVRAEAALLEGELRYRTLVELAPEMVAVQWQGVMVYVNSAGVRMLGASQPEDLLAHDFLGFVHPEDQLQVGGMLERVATESGTGRGDARLVRADGEVREIDLLAAPFSYSGTAAVQLLVRDMTDRRRAELALALREGQLADAERLAGLGSWSCELSADVAHGSDGLSAINALVTEAEGALPASWDWNAASDRISWSDGLYRIFGLDPATTRPDMQRLLELVHPEDRSEVQARFAHTIVSGQPYQFGHRVIRPDGAVRYLQARGRIELAPDGSHCRLLGTAQDITELEQIKEALAESEARFARWRAPAKPG